jgi:hypothetical protein
VRYNDSYWVGVDGSFHTGHRIELGRIEPIPEKVDLSKVPKNLAAIDKYSQDLKLRIMGADVPPEPYGSIEELYDELVTYYQTGLSLDPLTPYLLASYTLLTHQIPNLDFIFVVYITGLKGTGKSTTGDHLATVCYQAFKTGCATFPFLVRANEVFKGMTQILDEFDLIADDDHVTKYIRGSTDRNNPYGVVEGVPIDGQTYNMPAVKMSFGARVLITSLQIKDPMVRDRAVETIMLMNPNFMTKPTPEQISKIKAHLGYYRQQVKLTVTETDGKKWYQTKNSTGRLNETSTLLHVITPEKYHPQIDSIIDREWETRTQLERESYAAKVVEALTTAVIEQTMVESAKGEKYVAVQSIKYYFDQRYGDQQTGQGKTSEKSIGRVMNNLNLKTERVRLTVKDGNRQARGWKVNVDTLRSKRQNLYLDTESLEPLESSPSAPLGIDAYAEEKKIAHTLGNDSNDSNDSRNNPKQGCSVH